MTLRSTSIPAGFVLDPDYIELAKERIYKTQPALFAR